MKGSYEVGNSSSGRDANKMTQKGVLPHCVNLTDNIDH